MLHTRILLKEITERLLKASELCLLVPTFMLNFGLMPSTISSGFRMPYLAKINPNLPLKSLLECKMTLLV